MTTITWVHLSDWHQSGPEFERTKVRDALITDLENRAEIDTRLRQIDFVVFSGDVAFSGRAAEYETARTELVAPVLTATGTSPDRFIVVPGNHDVDRSVLGYFAHDLLAQFNDANALAEALNDARSRRMLLEPFAEYSDFARAVAPFGSAEHPAFGFSRTFAVDGVDVQIVALNSAVFSGRSHSSTGQVADEGNLLIGEAQYYAHLGSASAPDVRVAVVHHPFGWLASWERHALKRQLTEACDSFCTVTNTYRTFRRSQARQESAR